MSTIDDRIVSIKFDNAAFETKISETLASLDKLSLKISTIGSGKSFGDLTTASNSVDLSKLSSGVDNISGKFSAMGAVAFTAIQNITTSIMGAVTNFAKVDILGPIISGGKSRAENISQAEFQFRGLGINVDQAMAISLAAVKGTAYGLDEAAKAAAQFGASGIGAGKDMSTALSAIAGSAAMTGSSFSDMAYLFTTSAAQGRITNIDLQQFATRGLNAAAAVSKVMGVSEAQVHSMATAGTLDFKTFAAAMDTAFGAHATAANETYTGALANLHAAMSRLGASYFTPEMTQQRDLFNALGPVIDNVTAAMKPLITSFLDIRDVMNKGLIEALKNLDFKNFKLAMPNFGAGIKNAFEGVTVFLATIKSAFEEIFPPSATSKFLSFSEGFKNFTASLKMGAETANQVKSIFSGFFAVIAIGIAIVKDIFLVIQNLIQIFAPSTAGFLAFGAAGGNMLTKLKTSLVDGGGLWDFFVKLENYIVNAIGYIKQIEEKITSFFTTGFGSDVVSQGLEQVNGRLSSLSQTAETVKTAWQKVTDVFERFQKFLQPVTDYIGNWFSQLGTNIANAFKPADFNSALDIVNIGLLGGITIMLKNFLAGGLNVNFNTGLLIKIKSMFAGVTQSLQQMQANLRADTLVKIAAAMALLTVSIIALSLIDSANLAKALTAIAIGFGQLAGVMIVLDKSVTSAMGAVKLQALGVAMIEVAVAVDLLAIAITSLSKLSWEELSKGLIGVAGGLLLMIAAIKLMPTGSSMVAQGAGLVAISFSLGLIAEAMKIFATMSWSDMIKGFAGIGGGLVLIAGAMHLMPTGPALVAQGAGLVALGVSLNLIAASMLIFARMSWSELGKGIAGVGGGLLAIAGAMRLMPINLPITATGILILSVALNIMAKAIETMGANSVSTIAKGIGALAGMLLILVVAMNTMKGSIAGAAALVIVSGALLILTQVLERLGSMKLSDIVQGLAAVAAIFVVIGLAGKILTPVIPALMSLGSALALIGLGAALFGVGAMMIGKAFEMLAESGESGAKAIVASLKIIIAALPALAAGIALAVVNFAEELLKAAPLFVKLLTVVFEQLLQTIIKEAPLIAKAFESLISSALTAIKNTFPQLVSTGLAMLIALLKGIEDNIGRIVTLVANIMVNFITSLTASIPKLVTAAAGLIVAFLTELGNHVGEIVTAAADLIVSFITGITNNIGKVMTAGADLIVAIIFGLGNNLSKIIDAAGDMIVQFITGITNNIGKIMTAGGDLIISIIFGLGLNLRKIVDAGADVIVSLVQGIGNNVIKVVRAAFQTLVDFLNAFADAITVYTPQIKAAGLRIVIAIGQGMFGGIGTAMGDVMTWFSGLGARVFGWVGNVLGSLPGKGWDLIQGLFQGVLNRTLGVVFWFGNFATSVVSWLWALPGSLVSIGEKVIQGLWDGMQKVWEKAKSWLSKINPVNVLGDIGILDGHGLILLVPIGENLMIGLQNGMKKQWNIATTWLNKLNPVKDIDMNLSSILTTVTDTLGNMDEFNPVITPVLDLTKVQLASKDLAGYLGVSTISPDSSFAQANLISTTTNLAKTSTTAPIVTQTPDIIFTQTINAPTALSTNDIYRNTKSQIALAKEELQIS